MKRLLLALCMAATLAACGGDDALSTSEYRAEARKVCAESDRATDAVKAPTRTTNAAIASYFERLTEVSKASYDKLDALSPPEELEAEHEAALAANRDGVKEVERIVAELRRGGDARALLQNAQDTLLAIQKRSGDAARALGVPQCARQE